MKRKSLIETELSKAWDDYTSTIESFVDGECKDVELVVKGMRIYARIEALSWVLDNSDDYRLKDIVSE